VFLIVACYIWLVAARDRYILDLKCYQCGREGIVYISVIEKPRRRLRLAIDKVTEGFAVLEDCRSFGCVACKIQVRAARHAATRLGA
jgi:hypothetical protein